MRHVSRADRLALTLALLPMLVLGAASAALAQNTDWTSAGGDRVNSRHAKSESAISPATAGGLAVRWKFDTDADVSATPSVDATSIYVPDWAGKLHRIDRASGQALWSIDVTAITGPSFDGSLVISRTTPALTGDKAIFGTQGSSFFGGSPYIVAVGRDDGQLLWKTLIDETPFAIVTQSPVVYAGVVYVGLASAEEGIADFVPYACCKFRGSVVALDAATGAVLWKTYTVPPNEQPQDPTYAEYSGGGVWGSTVAVDPKRGLVYVTTGNNYSVPDHIAACVAAAPTPELKEACLAPDDYIDAILALDMQTGAVEWAKRLGGADAWNVACLGIFGSAGNPSQCPDPAGPDYDFGQGASLFTVKLGRTKRDLVGAGQKSGVYWALDRDSGVTMWGTSVGPGGTLGGLQWGSATDGERIYAAVSNNGHGPYAAPSPLAGTGSGGSWAALDAATGGFVWQVRNANPGLDAPYLPFVYDAVATAPMASANGVAFGCSMDGNGMLYAFDAASGAVLWSFASGGSCNAGPAIADGSVYWPTGYGRFGLGTGKIGPTTPRTGYTGIYAFGL